MCCADEENQTREKTVLESVHEPVQQNPLHYLTKTGSKRNGSELGRAGLRDGNNGAAGPTTWYIPIPETQIVQTKQRVLGDFLQQA